MTDGNLCAGCGKTGGALKTCAGCLDAKYCSVDCQHSHRAAHKDACNKRAAELLEEQLFRQPPPREDCPICFLPLPFDDKETTYHPCCSKVICFGCKLASDCNNQVRYPPCPFCRTPSAKSHEQANERVEKLMERNDAEAIRDRACAYELGDGGIPKDEKKAFELFTRAAKLGSAEAHNNLGNSYKNGRGCAVNRKKAKYHYQRGAILGDCSARNNLAVMEAVAGNNLVAMRHFMISASAGFEKSMDGMNIGLREGYISKEDFEKTQNAYNKAVNEMKSDQRDLGKSFNAMRRMRNR